MKRLKRPRRHGTLGIISGLLIASAVIRIGTGPGPALADDSAGLAEEEMPVTVERAETSALLEAFRARERRIAEQESLLQDRLQALNLAEAEIEEKLVALLAAEEALAATIALAEEASATDLERLTTVYENMKPKEAAELFQEMPPEFAAGFLGMMRPDAAALIMTQLAPETAYSFSVVLAGRNANVPTE